MNVNHSASASGAIASGTCGGRNVLAVCVLAQGSAQGIKQCRGVPFVNVDTTRLFVAGMLTAVVEFVVWSINGNGEVQTRPGKGLIGNGATP